MIRSIMVVASCLALAAGCSSSSTRRAAELQVRTQHVAGTDFASWQTFRLASTPPADAGSSSYPRYERMVRDALVEELTARGFRRAEDGKTDFRVASQLVFRGGRVPDGLDPTHGIDTGPMPSNQHKPSATLVIELLDPVTAEVLWRGELPGVEVDAVAPEVTLRTAVWRVLVEFPPIGG